MKFKHTSFHSIAPVDSQDSSIQSPVHPGCGQIDSAHHLVANILYVNLSRLTVITGL